MGERLLAWSMTAPTVDPEDRKEGVPCSGEVLKLRNEVIVKNQLTLRASMDGRQLASIGGPPPRRNLNAYDNEKKRSHFTHYRKSEYRS